MPKLSVPNDAPDWWRRAAPDVERAIAERPGQPSRLVRVATTADLPPAASWSGAMVFHVALGALAVSDGTNWFPVTVGAAL